MYYQSSGMTTATSSKPGQVSLTPYLDSLKGHQRFSIFDKIHRRIKRTREDKNISRISSNILLPQITLDSLHKSILVQNLRRNNGVSSNLDMGEHLMQMLQNSNVNSTAVPEARTNEVIRFDLEKYNSANNGEYPDFNTLSFGVKNVPGQMLDGHNKQIIRTMNPLSNVGSVLSRHISQTEIASAQQQRRRLSSDMNGFNALTTENLNMLNKSGQRGVQGTLPPKFSEKLHENINNYPVAGVSRRVREAPQQASPQIVGKFGNNASTVDDRDLISIQNILEQADYKQYQVNVKRQAEPFKTRNAQQAQIHTMPLQSKPQMIRLQRDPSDENEFVENVMHILDRSHSKYRMNIQDDYIIDSASAKKSFRYSPEKKKPIISPIIMVKSKQDRERLMQDSIKQTQANSRTLTRNSSVKLMESNMTRVKSHLSKTPVRDPPKEDFMLPDIKDYHRIVERGLERLEISMTRNYDEWCSLVKLCFDGAEPSTTRHTVNVASLELMRLHPIFNKLSFYGVRDFLGECKLVKLRANQLLYRQDDAEETTYIVVFGKIVLHHRQLGALGVVGMGQTLGEDALIESLNTPRKKVNTKKRREGAYAQAESYLLEIGVDSWRKVKSIMLQSGPASQGKTDVCHIERMLVQNYQMKNLWRMHKKQSYVKQDPLPVPIQVVKKNDNRGESVKKNF